MCMFKVLKMGHLITFVENVIYLVVQFAAWISRKVWIMPKFSQTSFSRLSTCHIDLQVLFFEVVRSFDCSVLEGYRNEEDQEKAFSKGNTQLHYPHGKHNHQPSMAVDVAPFPIAFDDIKRFYYFAGWIQGIAKRLKDEGKMTYSIRWGGVWDRDTQMKDNTFQDLVHYELI